MASLMDLNAEPAVADLSRQILSEAKLWEAIQEARDELVRRQHKMQVSVYTPGDRAGTPSAGSIAYRLATRYAAFRM